MTTSGCLFCSCLDVLGGTEGIEIFGRAIGGTSGAGLRDGTGGTTGAGAPLIGGTA